MKNPFKKNPLKVYLKNRHITQNYVMEQELEKLGFNISKEISYEMLEWMLLKNKKNNK